MPSEELAAYEEFLRKRGDITVWFDEAAVAAWKSRPSDRPGGQQKYSDLAIVTALTLRLVFHLALRQTEGFVGSLIRVMDLDLETPDHTTLSRRSHTVAVPALAKMHEEPSHLVIDSTGLKMVGEGEWHTHRHRTSNKRRSCRSLSPSRRAACRCVSVRATTCAINVAWPESRRMRKMGGGAE